MKCHSPAFFEGKKIYLRKLDVSSFSFGTVHCWKTFRSTFNSYSSSFSSHTLFITAYPYQVDKLKVLADSLASSSSKAEQRILEHRFCFWFFPVLNILLWHTIPYENKYLLWFYSLKLLLHCHIYMLTISLWSSRTQLKISFFLC